MDKAIQAVKQGHSSVQWAAIEHGVPQQNLHDRISGRVKHGTNPGPKPFLSQVEETDLASFLEETAKAGYGKNNVATSAVCVFVLMKKIKRKRLDFHGLNACVNDGFMKTVTVKW